MKFLSLTVLGFSLLTQIAQASETKVYKLYPNPHAQISESCDVYTQLTLTYSADKKRAHAELKEVVEGVCSVTLDPNERSYELGVIGHACGILQLLSLTRLNMGIKAQIVDNSNNRCVKRKGQTQIELIEYKERGKDNHLFSTP